MHASLIPLCEAKILVPGGYRWSQHLLTIFLGSPRKASLARLGDHFRLYKGLCYVCEPNILVPVTGGYRWSQYPLTIFLGSPRKASLARLGDRLRSYKGLCCACEPNILVPVTGSYRWFQHPLIFFLGSPRKASLARLGDRLRSREGLHSACEPYLLILVGIGCLLERSTSAREVVDTLNDFLRRKSEDRHSRWSKCVTVRFPNTFAWFHRIRRMML